MRHMKAMACAAAVAAAGAAGAATIVVSSDITTDQTWTSNNTYIIQGPIFVRDGAILTVQAGTLIRGTNPAPQQPGTLVVSRGSKIRMLGTREAPIVMTAVGDDHFVPPAYTNGTPPWNNPFNGITKQWGGLIVLGRTYIATAVYEPGTPSPNASIDWQIEGLQPYGVYGRYGGGNDDDDSGEIRFVQIRYGAYVLGANNEVNGLTCGAVGRGTKISHVEVFNNADDAFEFFGGTVNLKYLVAWADGDDGIDWDEGYRGKMQFVLRVQGVLATTGERSDKGAEMDGAFDQPGPQPPSVPTLYNVTMIGHGRYTNRKANTALHFRDGSGGRYYNSLFMDFGGACALIEGDINDSYPHDSADLTQQNYVKNTWYTHDGGGKRLEIANCVFWYMGTNVAFGCPANTNQLATTWGASGADGNLPHYSYPLFTDGTLSNTYLPNLSDLPVRDFVRATNNPVVIGSTTHYPVEFLDPTLPTNSTLLTAGRLPPADGFFTPVRMIGAFGTKNWADWTLVNKFGLIESDQYGEYSDPEINDAFVSMTIQFPTVVGATYTVQYTTNENTMAWTDLATGITGTGQNYKYTDQRPITEPRIYRVLSSQLAP